jgi:hypothetical protein
MRRESNSIDSYVYTDNVLYYSISQPHPSLHLEESLRLTRFIVKEPCCFVAGLDFQTKQGLCVGIKI